MKKIVLASFIFFFCHSVLAAVETYQFNNPEQEQLYYQVITQLRCPKCQNQSIADSDAPLSKDLRYVVYQKVMAGEGEQQIFSYMQQRYGDFVLYEPPVKPSNYFLWFGPLLIFLIIVITVLAKVGRRKVTEDDE